MSEYQWATNCGEIISGEYNYSLTNIDVKNLLEEVLMVNGNTINSIEAVEDYPEIYKINVSNFRKNYTFYVCIKNCTPGGRNSLKNEQRIQQYSKYINYAYHLLTNGACVLHLGIYNYNDNLVICAWKLKYSDANGTISKQIKIETIADAITSGFARQRKGNEYVYAFTKELFYFYLDNNKNLHEYSFFSTPTIVEPLNIPHQRIFFGAPGTGKSYKLNQESKQYFGENFMRVTFHPNYMYGNFVGQYKPYPTGDNSEKITYKFVPGILINQLVEALKNPDKNYLVIIEEINRANVAAVFGDLFQLLDRNSNGESEYSIAVTKELQDYFKNEAFIDELLNENIQEKLGENFSTLYLPNNLYIWATMNSADQGVMPMDTAFKRRWEFTYLGVNDAVDNNSDEFESYIFKCGDEEYKWNDYREQINERLSKLNIPEDKLLGPYFVSKNVLNDNDKLYISKVLKDKVLMYLYEDAARAFRGKLFKEGIYGTYSQLCMAFDDNPLTIFREEIDINPISTNNNQDSTDEN